MGKDSREEGRTGSDTAQGPAGPQIEDSARKPRRRTIHVLASGAGEGDRLISYTNGTQMRGINVVDHDVVFVVEATPEMLENLAVADRRPESGVWVRLDRQVPDPAGGFTLSSDNAQVTDMHHAVVLSDPEGNALLSVSRDGLLVELYDTEGQIIKRVNRSAEPWIRAQRGAVQDPAVEWSPREAFEIEVAEPPPVELTWPCPGGAPQRYSVTDEGEMDFSYLSLIQRRTMAVRLRTIASALNGDRS